MASKLMQACILAIWAVFLLWLASFGQQELARLLHPRLWWLVWCGAAVLLLFLAVALGCLRTSSTLGPLRWRWPSLVVLLVPLFFFTPMQRARFDSQTMRGRSTALQTLTTGQKDAVAIGGATAPASEIPGAGAAPSAAATVVPSSPPGDQGGDIVLAPSTVDPSQNEEDDPPSFRQVATDPARFSGKTVEVVCQTMRDASLPANQMLCYRFRITCCAADAQPVFLFVTNTAPVPFRNDSWVKVQGQVSLYTLQGRHFALMHDARITAAKEPAFPFVF